MKHVRRFVSEARAFCRWLVTGRTMSRKQEAALGYYYARYKAGPDADWWPGSDRL